MNFTFNYRGILPGDADIPAPATFSVAEIKTLHNMLLDAIDYADRYENTSDPEHLQLSGRLETLLASLEKPEKGTLERMLDGHKKRGVRV